MKEKLIFAVAVIVLIMILVGTLVFVFKDCIDGISSIRISVHDDTANIKIRYSLSSYGRYSVEMMDENEGEFIGDGLIDYDGALGKYRVKVTFGDTELSIPYAMKLLDKHEGGFIELKNSPIKVKMRFGSAGDHGVTMYFGFDVPISVEETSGELNELGGTVKIPIKISE